MFLDLKFKRTFNTLKLPSFSHGHVFARVKLTPYVNDFTLMDNHLSENVDFTYEVNHRTTRLSLEKLQNH